MVRSQLPSFAVIANLVPANYQYHLLDMDNVAQSAKFILSKCTVLTMANLTKCQISRFKHLYELRTMGHLPQCSQDKNDHSRVMQFTFYQEFQFLQF